MNESYMTVVGNVVDEPRYRLTDNGYQVVSFRIAATERKYDKVTGQMVDKGKLFVTVTCWRDFARNIANSVRKGQPLVVYGTLSTREYSKDEVLRQSYEIDAVGIGHNLARGTSVFTKVARSVVSTSVEVGPDGMPADLTDERFGPGIGEVDPFTVPLQAGPFDSPDSTPVPELVEAVQLVGAGSRSRR
jgi:single-strand DNA-binding protein